MLSILNEVAGEHHVNDLMSLAFQKPPPTHQKKKKKKNNAGEDAEGSVKHAIGTGERKIFEVWRQNP